MTHQLKNTFSLLSLGTILGATALLTGCGGGGGGNSTPSPTSAPSPLDASYNAVFAPIDAVATDAKAPSGNLTINRSRATLQTTFFVQPSISTEVQKRIDSELNNRGYGFAIPSNQFPTSVVFNGSGTVDANGKLNLTAQKSSAVCGTATLTIEPTFSQNGTIASGTGSYQITFPADAKITVRGRTGNAGFSCNLLPLRLGTVVYSK